LATNEDEEYARRVKFFGGGIIFPWHRRIFRIKARQKKSGEKRMNRLITAVAVLVLTFVPAARAQVNPCQLLPPAEIESALGTKVTCAGTAQWGATPTCAGGAAPKHMSVMVMFSPGDAAKANDPKWADPLGYLEQMSRQSANSIKAQLDA